MNLVLSTTTVPEVFFILYYHLFEYLIFSAFILFIISGLILLFKRFI